MSDSIGIIGFGIIGTAVYELFSKAKINFIIYDPKIKCPNEKNSVFDVFTDDKQVTKDKISKCKIAFICVPTPHMKYDGLDMSFVEECVKDFSPEIFVICSALQPGTANRLSKKYNKKIVVQPEYFGETTNHPLVNLGQQRFLILGGESEDVDEVIILYQKAYNANVNIRKVTALEAEVIKLSENRAIGYKVLQCQELYDTCKSAGVDYNVIRQAVYGDDPRFNLWWTFVYKDKRGLTSSCLPKDLYGWQKWAKDNNVDPELTLFLLEYNDKLIEKNK